MKLSQRRKIRLGKNENVKKYRDLDRNEEKLKIVKEFVFPNIDYRRIKYRDNYYYIGDCIVVKSLENCENLIGKIVRIIPFGGIERYPYWPTIEVQVFYTREDIDQEKNGLMDEGKFESLSEFEVFKTEEKKICYVEHILSKCSILTFDEYESLKKHTLTTFFSRADYNISTHLFEPPIEKWKKSCTCNNPLNPDQFYILCEKCENWYHTKCCGISDHSIESLVFYCQNCK